MEKGWARQLLRRQIECPPKGWQARDRNFGKEESVSKQKQRPVSGTHAAEKRCFSDQGHLNQREKTESGFRQKTPAEGGKKQAGNDTQIETGKVIERADESPVVDI